MKDLMANRISSWQLGLLTCEQDVIEGDDGEFKKFTFNVQLVDSEDGLLVLEQLFGYTTMQIAHLQSNQPVWACADHPQSGKVIFRSIQRIINRLKTSGYLWQWLIWIRQRLSRIDKLKKSGQSPSLSLSCFRPVWAIQSTLDSLKNEPVDLEDNGGICYPRFTSKGWPVNLPAF